jgi:hypothetical protein
MAKNIQLNPIQPVKQIFGRYNFVIFVVIVSVLLIFSVTVLSAILSQQTDDKAVITSDFDQVTMNRLSGLETSANNTNYNNLPTGRINPFFE